jgi:hypothetical protein
MFLTPVLLIILITACVFVVIALASREKEAKRLSLIRRSIIGSEIGADLDLNEYAIHWARVVERGDLLEPVINRHNVLIFGRSVSGRHEIMVHATNLVNAAFKEERHMAIYLDMQELVIMSTSLDWVSTETLFRDVVSAPLMWYRNLVQQSPLQAERNLLQADRELRRLKQALIGQLSRPFSEIDPIAVRIASFKWMDRLDIGAISLFLDNFSSLPSESGPIVLEMLSDVFPRGSRLSLKIGGNEENLIHERITSRGRVGLQVHHDLLIGLDVERILRSPDLRPSRNDPRQVFLLTLLDLHMPDIAARVQSQGKITWDSVFSPSESWFALFRESNFHIGIVGAAFVDLFPELRRPIEKTITISMIKHAIARAQTKSQSQRIGA